MPLCNQRINDQNESKAPGIYEGARVMVLAVDTTSQVITFTAFGEDGSSKTCTAKWGETSIMWPACPSSLPSQATADDSGPPPAVGATGILYLHVDYLAKNQIVAAPPKWPKALGATLYKPLMIWPTSVVLEGIEVTTGDQTKRSIDLLDPRLARAGQTIWLGGQPIELLLSEPAFAEFGVEFELPFDAWGKLSEAVATVEDDDRDPSKLTEAWSVVAACIERLDIDRQAGLVTERHLQDLRKVLPNHTALKDITP